MEKKSKSSPDLLNAYEQKIKILEQIKDVQAKQIKNLEKIVENQKEINALLKAERNHRLIHFL